MIEIQVRVCLPEGWKREVLGLLIPDPMTWEAREQAIGKAIDIIREGILGEFYPELPVVDSPKGNVQA